MNLKSLCHVFVGFLPTLLIAAADPASASVKPPCQSLSECSTLRTQAEARLQFLEGNAEAPITNVVRKADGTILMLSHHESAKYCQDHGSTLLTARELAILSMSMGADGIKSAGAPGYALVHTKESNGGTDSFYFSSNGYHGPYNGTFSNLFYWSSSENYDSPSYSMPSPTTYPLPEYVDMGGYGFWTANGNVAYHGNSSDLGAVLCENMMNAPSPGGAPPLNVCDSVNACGKLENQIDAEVSQLKILSAPTYLDVVRNSDGTAKLMTEQDAESYCKGIGAHLPTDVELARLTTTYGAQMPLASDYVKVLLGGQMPAGYTVPDPSNPDDPENMFVKFYVNPSGYQPTGDQTKYVFWSRTPRDLKREFYYALEGASGRLELWLANQPYYTAAVRCAK